VDAVRRYRGPGYGPPAGVTGGRPIGGRLPRRRSPVRGRPVVRVGWQAIVVPGPTDVSRD